METTISIDVTPTWGQWGNIFYRFAVSGDRGPLEIMHPDLAKALSVASAFVAIQESLTGDQIEKADAVFRAEMKKQGYPTGEGR